MKVREGRGGGERRAEEKRKGRRRRCMEEAEEEEGEEGERVRGDYQLTMLTIVSRIFVISSRLRATRAGDVSIGAI